MKQLSDAQKSRLFRFNDRPLNFNPESDLVTLFKRQAASRPDNIAVEFGNEKLTYAQLNKQSDAFHEMLKANNVGKGDYVGICLDRSVELISGILGIIKTGAAYVPFDPAYPTERIEYMLTQSGVRNVICSASYLNLFSGEHIKVFKPEEAISFENADSNQLETATDIKRPVYILFTSGSTGNPKGVVMTEGAVLNLLNWQSVETGLGKPARTLQFAPISFDVSFQEIFSTLTTGGTLVLINDEMRLNAIKLLEFINSNRIERLYLPFIALQHLAEVAVKSKIFPSGLKDVVTAGEQLQITKHIREFFTNLPDCKLHNHYGPTETHVVTALTLDDDVSKWEELPAIGFPVSNTHIYLLNESLEPVSDNEQGEIYIAGAALAAGYVNRDDLTDERFINNPFAKDANAKMYRTGDLASYNEHGIIYYLGRADNQVKVRGYRIEPGEIELAVAKYPGIDNVVVIAREDIPGDKRLVAYYVYSGNEKNTESSLRVFLTGLLPDYMIPSAFVKMDKLPVTPSGKTDRRALPAPGTKRPESDVPYKAPSAIIEKNICEIWSQLLCIDKVGVDDNFFFLGGNSLLALQFIARYSQEFGFDIPVVKLYQAPTVTALVSYISGKENKVDIVSEAKNRVKRSLTGSSKGRSVEDGLAVIGFSGRFPGADSVEEFWNNLIEGKETTTFFRDEELDPFIDRSLTSDPLYVKARGIIRDADKFDAPFFNISPRLAETMDPQHRLFLQICWEALEISGYSPAAKNGLTGVFAGTGNNTYFPNNLSEHKELIEKVGTFQVMTGNEKDYIATRVSHILNLKGPAVSVHTACSTSLTAVALACQSLWNYQCDMAIAGGISVTSPVNSGHIYLEGGMFSSDGHTRSFDSKASGTVFSDGGAVVVLKRYRDAVNDGDTIYAVVRGIGINNDGAEKSSFTAPSVEGQAAAIAMAHASAGVSADTIGYVETHGTATPIGDPIEIEALALAFGDSEKGKQYCAIGSAKSNFGHLTAAAGVTGLIKTVLSLRNKVLPATLNFYDPNPAIKFESTPFYVNTKLNKWERGETPLRAGVSSFGVGGTNVHVVLEEAPAQLPSGIARPCHLLTFSTRNKNQTDQLAASFAEFYRSHPGLNMADAAFTLQTGRHVFRDRRITIVNSGTDVLHQLEKPLPVQTASREFGTPSSGVVFMFPGQGSQYVNMGLTLYRDEPVFRDAVDRCANILISKAGFDIREVLYPGKGDEDKAAGKLKNTEYTQPALFTIGYALAQLWMSWGIKPTALIGHSVGEFCAACIAGVMSLEDALYVVSQRGKLMQQLPSGSMVSVRMKASELELLLSDKVSIAAINGPELCVMSGEDNEIERIQSELEKKDIICKKLHTSHAFHSPMMDPIVETFRNLIASVKLNPPSVTICSTSEAKFLTDDMAMDPGYWSQHIRKPVRFAEGIKVLWQEDPALFMLELGPRNTASTLARQQATDIKSQIAVPSLPDKTDNNAEWISMMYAIGQMWLSGIDFSWQNFYAMEKRNHVALPTYPFEKIRYWIDPVNVSAGINTFQPYYPFNSSVPQAGFETNTIKQQDIVMNTLSRKERIIAELRMVMEEASGIELTGSDPASTFMELGMDSLFLTQSALTISKKYGVKITFRQLNEEFASLDSLAVHLDSVLPADSIPAAISSPSVAPASPLPGGSVPQNLQWLIMQQMQIMQQQLAVINGTAGIPVSTPASNITDHVKNSPPAGDNKVSENEKAELEKPFGAIARIEKVVNSDLTVQQKKWLSDFTKSYNDKTAKSKSYTQENRAHLADPRVVTGFKPNLKELIYQAVVDHSEGCMLRDIDGNEYVDVLNGFGSNFLGYGSKIILDAVKKQLEEGIEIGPQHPLAGEMTKLICEFTGYDRAGLCNTGSEAVLGAMRIARTVTGRSTIVCFNGSYHGINDEVIVRGTKKLKSFPAAAGIMPEAVQNMLVLDYGTDEALEIIRSRADEIAAVLVEPIQSRRADFKPKEFLKEVRKITEESGSVLIFDEVITGFRLLPGGAQEYFDIKADLSTYGKVIGGGMPVGAIAGRKEFMDALDGGYWKFGDESVPEAGVTYFAGTFVRHPLALAAGVAVLKHLKERGRSIYDKLNGFTDKLVSEINSHCISTKSPFHLVNFGSLFKVKWDIEIPYGELVFLLLRHKGVHIYDGFPCFITDAFTEKDVDFVIQKFIESIDELQSVGFLKLHEDGNGLEKHKQNGSGHDHSDKPPVEGARKGTDQDGNPAWFINDPDRPGKFIKVG